MKAALANPLVRRLIRNAVVVVAATAVFGFKAAERAPVAERTPVSAAARQGA